MPILIGYYALGFAVTALGIRAVGKAADDTIKSAGGAALVVAGCGVLAYTYLKNKK